MLYPRCFPNLARLGPLLFAASTMINMMILYDFVVENLCVTIVIREEGSSQLSELKSFWIAFGALATKLRQSVLSKSAPGFSKWIMESSWSSQNWAKHTGVHRQLYPTSQPCVYKGLRTPVEMRIWKSESCGFTGVFLLSLFGKDFPIWLEGNVSNATMNHYLDSYLVVRCLGHFRFSFFEIQRIPPQVKSDSQLDPLKRRHSWKFWSGINLVKVWVRDILMHVSLLDHVVLHGFYEGGTEPEKKGSTWDVSKVQWQAR